MANQAVITCSLLASPLVSNKAALNPSKITLGPQSVAFRGPTSAKTTPSSRVSSLVVRAQSDDGGMSKEISQVAKIIDTSPYRTPWNMTEDENEIRMWSDVGIDVNVVDNLLIIKGTEVTDAFGKKNPSPFDCKVQLPINCAKEETQAVFKNGVLNIYVPKITRADHKKFIHVPVRGL